MFDFEMKGFDELEKNLKDLQERAENLDGEHNIPLTELFNEKFMTKYTDYNAIDEMFENSGFQVETAEDFKKIPDKEWDIFINESTVFENWEDMQLKAFAERTAGQLGLK